MEYYECIVNVANADNGECQIFISGVAEPGKDLVWLINHINQYFYE